MRTKHTSMASLSPTVGQRFWPRIEKTDTCWNWTGGVTSQGYGIIGSGGRGNKITTHRLAYLLCVGPIPNNLWVLHRCDNRRCVRPDHLYLGDVVQNTRDMVDRGRHPSHVNPALRQGENHPRAKLTLHKVEEIRARYARGGVTLRRLGEEYGVTESTTWQIVHRKNWSP